MKRLTTGTLLTHLPMIVVLLVCGNGVAFLWCLHEAGTPDIPPGVLVADGALIPAALQPGGTWRLLAAGFLHVGPAHLLTNLVSLVICGPFLERRLGSSAFAIVYATALVGAAVTSVLLHAGPFVGVGASGAIFGVLGALFALWVLGATELSPGFFLGNFALNAAFAARDPHIDWAAHIGGFVSGLVAIAILDLIVRTNGVWLRCKFPEFVKMNTLLLIGVGAAWLWSQPLPFVTATDPRWIALATGAGVLLFAVKLLDMLLSVRHGLAAVVVILALGNGAAASLAIDRLRPGAVLLCRSVTEFGGDLEGLAGVLCPHLSQASLAIVGIAAVLTLVVYAVPLRRGWRDVGFVGATFRGDRQRERRLVRPIQHTRA